MMVLNFTIPAPYKGAPLPPLHVRLVQPNIGNFLKIDSEQGGENSLRSVFDSYFDRLFGKTGTNLKIDIKPVGEINIRAGYQGQNVKNPTLPERARKNGGFDFDANTNFSLNIEISKNIQFY
jgi:cell surface protein SprA